MARLTQRASAAIAWLALTVPALTQSVSPVSSDPAVQVIESSAPEGLESVRVNWIRISTPSSGVMLAAVVRPPGKGPFPAVILLHGSHGFAREYLGLAAEISDAGVVAIAPCWFSGSAGSDNVAVSAPIPCPEALSMPMGPSEAARRIVGDLVQAARAMPEVRGDRIGLFGHSRGGGATVNFLVHGGDVRAAILNSSGYTDEFIAVAQKIQTQILILHGTADSNSAFTTVERARAFESALLQGGRRPHSHYYEKGEHSGIFTDSRQHADELRRIVAFLQQTLR